MKEDTKELIFGLIRTEFDGLDFKWEHIYFYGRELIKATIELELIEEAKEMISDAIEYGYNYTNLLK
jgi:hypothetical protein